MSTPRDIHARVFAFAVQVVRLVDRLPRTVAGTKIGQQLVGSGTAVGAVMQEADAAESKRDFVHKVGVALKEAQETYYWLKIVDAALLPADDTVRAQMHEAYELSRILGAIRRNASLPK